MRLWLTRLAASAAVCFRVAVSLVSVTMRFSPTAIRDLLVLTPRLVEDGRGYFMETYRKSELREAGIEANFVQENQSGSRGGVLRGLHYQIQKPQGKLIRVVQGE